MTLPATVSVPGTLAVGVAVDPTADDADLQGAILLSRGTEVRRIPFWGHLSTPALAGATRTAIAGPGVFKGNTRGRPALVSTYRYPDVSAGGPVASTLGGPEQIFRLRLKRAAVNFGVVVLTRGRGVQVEPRVVVAGNENRLTGYPGLPIHLNPYLVDYGSKTGSAGAIAPLAGTYDLVFDSASPAGAGAFTFRLWVNDVTRPSATLLSRTVKRGAPLSIRLSDKGSGIDPSSLQVTLGGKETRAAIVGGVARVDTSKLKPGTTLLRLQVSDHQESRNMENVGPILPNTRVLTARITITR